MLQFVKLPIISAPSDALSTDWSGDSGVCKADLDSSGFGHTVLLLVPVLHCTRKSLQVIFPCCRGSCRLKLSMRRVCSNSCFCWSLRPVRSRLCGGVCQHSLGSMLEQSALMRFTCEGFWLCFVLGHCPQPVIPGRVPSSLEAGYIWVWELLGFVCLKTTGSRAATRDPIRDRSGAQPFAATVGTLILSASSQVRA